MTRPTDFPLLQRFINIEPAAIVKRANATDDLTLSLALASEYPVARWFGTEILSVEPNAIRTARLNDGASVLFNHDPDEIRGSHIPGSVKIGADRVLRADVKLTPATQAGRDAIALVEGGHLTKVSEGYRIHNVIEKTSKKSREIDGATFERILQATLAERGQDGVFFRSMLDQKIGTFDRSDNEEPTYLVTDWEPFETSLTTVPADPTVGIGRQFERQRAATKGIQMSDEQRNDNGGAGAQQSLPPAGNEGANAERLRIQTLYRLASQHKIDDPTRDDWIGKGVSVEQASQKILDVLAVRGDQNKTVPTRLDLSARDTRQYSMLRAVIAAYDKDWSKAGFEAECSREIATRLGKVPDSGKFYVPLDIQSRQGIKLPADQQRTAVSQTDSAGGFLIQTSNVGFIEMLRNRSVLFSMGARRLSGLVGDVMIPKQSAAATAYWLTNDTTAITGSQPTFAQVALTPKNVGAYTEISRQLALQGSPDAEGLVMADVAAVVALAVDLAGIAGTGAPQPQGIIGSAGVGSVTGTTIAYAGILEFESDVMTGNALVNPATFGYIMTPINMALLKARSRFANTDTPLWENSNDPGVGRVNGYRAMASLQVPTGDILAGDFSQVVIGEWGVLEVGINPYANFPAGIIGVRAIYSVDVAVRYGASFSLATSVT